MKMIGSIGKGFQPLEGWKPYYSRTLSGRFWFDATNSAGEKVEIREGRFDILY